MRKVPMVSTARCDFVYEVGALCHRERWYVVFCLFCFIFPFTCRLFVASPQLPLLATLHKYAIVLDSWWTCCTSDRV